MYNIMQQPKWEKNLEEKTDMYVCVTESLCSKPETIKHF